MSDCLWVRYLGRLGMSKSTWLDFNGYYKNFLFIHLIDFLDI